MKRRTFLAATGLAIPNFKFAFAAGQKPRFLFIVCANGGASIMDSFLPISKANAGANIHSFQNTELETSGNFTVTRSLDPSIENKVKLGPVFSLKTFADKHKEDLLVLCHNVSSVNHQVAAHRALTGDGVNRGKTLGEAVAEAYGENVFIPNITMAQGGFSQDGVDSQIPPWARAELIANPINFPYSMSFSYGINGYNSELMNRMRMAREKFEKQSPITKEISDYQTKRKYMIENLNSDDLFQSIQMRQNQTAQTQTRASMSPLDKVLAKFPRLYQDPFQAQAGLAFLLAKANMSRSITIDPGANPLLDDGRFVTAPIGFDWSHRDHRGAQNAMWSRVISVTDALIDLLKAEPAFDELGKTMWDQSLIYIATEFGRDKVLGSGGSGHHVNNGSVIISPLIKGHRIAGGINPSSGLTYGCDLATGTPDASKVLFERDVYSLILAALGINFPNQTNCSAFIA